jgi:hypothetical protein
MANVLSTLRIDWERLQEFTDDLEGVLSMIAYAGYDKDQEFIRRRKRELAEEYENEIELVGDIPLFAFEMIDRAWVFFDEGIRAEDAADLVQEYLLFDSQVSR